jgi:L-lactate dehydrogenase
VHGDSQVVAWSAATIGGVPIDKYLPPGTFNQAELANECKLISQSIVLGKGARPLGIGSVISTMCSSILFDKRKVRPISHFQPEFGCCISLPAVLGRKGIIRTIHMPLNNDEEANIAEPAKTLRDQIKRINSSQ